MFFFLTGYFVLPPNSSFKKKKESFSLPSLSNDNDREQFVSVCVCVFIKVPSTLMIVEKYVEDRED